MSKDKHIDNHNSDQPISEEQNTKTQTESTDTKEPKLEDKITELNDKYLRLYSEFDNYRKRTNKERIDIIENASKELIKEILPVVDDFERCLTSISKIDNPEVSKNVEGVNLVYKKLYSILQSRGLKPIEAMGKDFDEKEQEAIAQIPSTKEQDKGKVVDVVTKGYYLNDMVLRYAKVVVSK